MSATSSENGDIGQSLLQRIGVRERERVQVKFLQLLKDTPLWEQMVFRGAVALHGVYLHGRCSKDLDFLAAPEVVKHFCQMANSYGMNVQDKSEESKVFTFSLPGTVFNRLVVGIDVCSRNARAMNWEISEFTSLSGQRVSVRVQPFAEMMAEKLRAVTRRGRVTDFFDVWFGLEKRAQFKPQIQALLKPHAIVKDPFRFDAAEALDRLSEHKEEWFETLAPLMVQVPEFGEVQHDLQHWLPLLRPPHRFERLRRFVKTL